MLDTFSMVKEISVMEQRYQAVLAVIADGRGVGEVAAQFGVSRQSVHAWHRRPFRLMVTQRLVHQANRSLPEIPRILFRHSPTLV
jgi:transposase-like protein